jgi:two-component system response regulator DesR
MAYRTVLADDNYEYNEWLASLLNKSEFFVISGQAYDGKTTIKLVKSTKPDLLILDIDIPKLSGLKVARYIRYNLPDTKIILISTFREHIYEELAKQEGVLAFIPKVTLSLSSLLRVLKEKGSRL